MNTKIPRTVESFRLWKTHPLYCHYGSTIVRYPRTCWIVFFKVAFVLLFNSLKMRLSFKSISIKCRKPTFRKWFDIIFMDDECSMRQYFIHLYETKKLKFLETFQWKIFTWMSLSESVTVILWFIELSNFSHARSRFIEK